MEYKVFNRKGRTSNKWTACMHYADHFITYDIYDKNIY